MKSIVTAFVSGVLFSAGIVVSGMVRPAKVLAFLDVTGHWDPSLAIVMGVGVVVVGIACAYVGRSSPLRARIDRRLLSGAVLFGLGWGAIGYCPGPAVIAFATGERAALWFVPGMVAGMALYSFIAGRYTDETGAAGLHSAPG